MRSASAVGWSGVATTESSLVERCAAGDEEACRALVKTHQVMVFQLAVALLGDREEAIDVSPEVFLRIFRTIGTVRGETALRTWVYRIVVNQARNRRRWWARRGRSAPGIARVVCGSSRGSGGRQTHVGGRGARSAAPRGPHARRARPVAVRLALGADPSRVSQFTISRNCILARSDRRYD